MTPTRRVLPRIVDRGGPDATELDPYSTLYADRIIVLGAPLDDETANAVASQLLCLDHDNPRRDIRLYLNSPGGSLTAALAVYDTMQFVAADIQTVCVGQAAGSAALLLAAGAPGKRLALPNARIVARGPALDPDRAAAPAADVAIRAAEVRRLADTVERLLGRHTGLPADRVHALLDRGAILTAAEALAHGLVDELVAPVTLPRAG